MKIEKINDSQIRCTLTRTDLQSRELKISELAYGTEKAKVLFQDMIEQASNQFGFETDDLPLMIEAIPVSPDCIILNITKVEDPEELDTRFSKFAPADDTAYNGDDSQDWDYEDIFPEPKETKDEDVELLENILQKVSEFIPMKETLASIKSGLQTDSGTSCNEQASLPDNTNEPVMRLYSFSSYNDASRAARGIYGTAVFNSSLYKDEIKGIYYLLLTSLVPDSEAFLKICNQITEFGHKEPVSYSTTAYLKEHCETIISQNAIRILMEY